MPTTLPPHANIEHLKKQAKDLHDAHAARDPAACKILRRLRQFTNAPDGRILDTPISLSDAQFALALEYGFKGWNELKAHVAATTGGDAMPTKEEALKAFKAQLPDAMKTLETELSGKPTSLRKADELIPLLVALDRVLFGNEFELGSLESAVDRIDDDILHLGLKWAVNGADRDYVVDLMASRKKILLADCERRLDLIIAGVTGIAEGMSPSLLADKCRTLL
jgi:hypothetical protein